MFYKLILMCIIYSIKIA